VVLEFHHHHRKDKAINEMVAEVFRLPVFRPKLINAMFYVLIAIEGEQWKKEAGLEERNSI